LIFGPHDVSDREKLTQATEGHSTLKSIIQQATDKLLVACLVLMTLIPLSPIFTPFPTRDPGVFLYVGWRILNGEIPYRDIWDHKPPVIFYINALGLSLTDNSRWGVWILEFVFLFLAALIGFQLLKRLFGFYPSTLSLLLWLLTLPLLFADGNFTNEYTLPLQFLALWLFYDLDKQPATKLSWFIIGLTGTIAFFTKQTTIGVWIGILFLSLFKRLKDKNFKSLTSDLLSFSGGMAFISIAIVAYFGSQGALDEFWCAAFKYNFTYFATVTSTVERSLPLLMGIDPLTESGLFQFAAIGYGIGALLLLFNREVVIEWKNLLLLGLIDLPLEFFLANISGRVYPHYYISILPVLSLFAGFTFWIILRQLSAWKIPNTAQSIFQLGVLVAFLWGSMFNYAFEVRVHKQVWGTSVIDYIKTHTSPDDYVLMWGAEAGINYMSQRRSPTPYIYLYPLYARSYVNEQMILEFLDDILRKKPFLMIDTKNDELPMFEFPLETETITNKVTEIKSNYQAVENIDGWIVYEHIEAKNAP
jgi:hypothetical protein